MFSLLGQNVVLLVIRLLITASQSLFPLSLSQYMVPLIASAPSIRRGRNDLKQTTSAFDMIGFVFMYVLVT